MSGTVNVLKIIVGERINPRGGPTINILQKDTISNRMLNKCLYNPRLIKLSGIIRGVSLGSGY